MLKSYEVTIESDLKTKLRAVSKPCTTDPV
jgi:hypothetical protein